MTWSTYGSYLAFAVILVLVPGPDFAVVTKNTLAGGRRRGAWSSAGVASSNAVQGVAAAAGLGAVIVRIEPVFEAVKWAGIAYLLFPAHPGRRTQPSTTDPGPSHGATKPRRRHRISPARLQRKARHRSLTIVLTEWNVATLDLRSDGSTSPFRSSSDGMLRPGRARA